MSLSRLAPLTAYGAFLSAARMSAFSVSPICGQSVHDYKSFAIRGGDGNQSGGHGW